MSNKIFIPKPNYIKEIFEQDKAIIGMVHLKPLPGAPYYNREKFSSIYDLAMKDISIMEEAGFDGLIIENAWDIPFSKPEDIGFETVASMTALTQKIKEQTSMKIGISCLANGAIQALSIAKATEVSFIRVNQWVNAYVANEGLVEGASAKAMRYRSKIKAEEIKVFTDVHVKHGSHSIVADRKLADQTHDAVFFDSDALIATGTRTGNETEITEIQGIKDNTDLPVIVGSGMNRDNAKKILKNANGCIVGSSIKKEGKWWNPIDKKKAYEFMSRIKEVRQGG